MEYERLLCPSCRETTSHFYAGVNVGWCCARENVIECFCDSCEIPILAGQGRYYLRRDIEGNYRYDCVTCHEKNMSYAAAI